MIITARERLRFDVSSRTGQEPFLVDLGSILRHGACLGRCTCQDFTIHIVKAVRDMIRHERMGADVFVIKFRNQWIPLGKPGVKFQFIPSDDWRCGHILAARRHHDRECGERVIMAIRAKYPDYGVEEEEV